jgi:alpha-L-fucosidase
MLLAGAVLFASASSFAVTQTLPTETKAQRDHRMKWWREARFGMFIHFGLYSEAAGEWNGKQIPGMGEWIIYDGRIPLADYMKLQERFNPTKFDAEKWARIAKNAGMKYVVLTAKHIDGFCTFGTKLSDFNVTQTPFKRDILKELSQAVRHEGLKMCTYYSVTDFAYPDYAPLGPGSTWSAFTPVYKNPDFKKYLTYMFGQLRELLTNYGPIGVMWFDACYDQGPEDIHGTEMVKMMRSIQPNLIINNRFGLPLDFDTPEQTIPATGIPGRDWETCMTINDTWGFKKSDTNWKSTETLLRNVIDIVSKGGNYLLNVGPTGEGEFPEAIVTRLEEIGRWMKVNGDAIHGTTASPFRELRWGRCTQKPGKLFLHVFDWPTGELVVPGLLNPVKRAYLLSDRKKTPLKVIRQGEDIAVSLPAQAPDKIASVVVLELKGKVEIAPYSISQDPSGSVTMTALDALVQGSTAKYDPQHDDIGYWTDANDRVSWDFTIARPGTFDLEIVYGCQAENDGSEFAVNLAGQNLTGKVIDTGGWYSFKTFKLGQVTFDRMGRQTLMIKAVSMPKGAVMNLKSVVLKPTGA